MATGRATKTVHQLSLHLCVISVMIMIIFSLCSFLFFIFLCTVLLFASIVVLRLFDLCYWRHCFPCVQSTLCIFLILHLASSEQ